MITTGRPRPAATRQRILAAALRLFAERGYSATSVGEIEAAAGLAPRAGGLYKHFPSKLSLLEEAIGERMREIDEFNSRLDLAPLGDLGAELTLIARWALAELRKERELVLAVMKEGDRVPALRERFCEAIVRRGHALAIAVILRYAEGRDLSVSDPEAVAEIACSGLVGFSLQQALFGDDFSGVDEERFVAAWVEANEAMIANLQRRSEDD
jgi:AcrR family transcriptional regulator